jgi:hypothetical protein
MPFDCGLSTSMVRGTRPTSPVSAPSPAGGGRRAVVRQSLDRLCQAGHQPISAFDAFNHQIADVSPIDAASGRHAGVRLAITQPRVEADK